MFQYVSAQNDTIMKRDFFSYIIFSKKENTLSAKNKLILDNIISAFEPYKDNLDDYILIHINFNSHENSKFIYDRLDQIFIYFEKFGYSKDRFIIKLEKMKKFEKFSAYSFVRYKRCYPNT